MAYQTQNPYESPVQTTGRCHQTSKRRRMGLVTERNIIATPRSRKVPRRFDPSVECGYFPRLGPAIRQAQLNGSPSSPLVQEGLLSRPTPVHNEPHEEIQKTQNIIVKGITQPRAEKNLFQGIMPQISPVMQRASLSRPPVHKKSHKKTHKIAHKRRDIAGSHVKNRIKSPAINARKVFLTFFCHFYWACFV